MEWTGDVERGAWLVERQGTWGSFGGIAATGFEAYARILHPFDADRDGTEARWSWAEVARRTGVTLHPRLASERMTHLRQQTFPDGWTIPGEAGEFGPTDLAALVELLAPATSRPDDVTVGIWHGHGNLHPENTSVFVAYQDTDTAVDPPEEPVESIEAIRARLIGSVDPAVARAANVGPTLELPGREYVLLAGALDDLRDPTWGFRAGIGWTEGSPWPGPDLLWTADHAWLVATDTDLDWTVVAGSRALVDMVLTDGRFEAFAVDPAAMPDYPR